MINLEVINTEKTQEYINAIYSRRSALSNYYGQKFEKKDKFFQTNDTFLQAKPVRDFYRIYFSSNDKKELTEILQNLEGTNVINFPTKSEISEIQEFMNECGYEQIGIYERFVYDVKKLKYDDDISNIEFAATGDEEQIYNLYSSWKGFNPYTDYLPTLEELKKFIENKTVIINKQDNKIVGVCTFEPQGRKYYSGLYIDISKDGLTLIMHLFNILKHNKIEYLYFWVNADNKRVKTLHQLLGATPDGLKDYTFIKK